MNIKDMNTSEIVNDILNDMVAKVVKKEEKRLRTNATNRRSRLKHKARVHRENTIYNWKRRGVVLRDCETWNGVYDVYMATVNCESCDIVLDDSKWKTHRCLDHWHKDTWYTRGTICFLCNSNDHWQKRMTSTSVYNFYKL